MSERINPRKDYPPRDDDDSSEKNGGRNKKDRRAAVDAKRNGGELPIATPIADAKSEAQSTAIGLAMQEAEARRKEERELGVSVGNEVFELLSKQGAADGSSMPEAVSKDVANVPSELSAIFGDKIPADALRLYERLPESRREGYLEKLRADVARSKKKSKKSPTSSDVRSAKKSIARRGLDIDLSESAAQTEEPFDPHSVPSVDESTLNASQYTINPEMQADMDVLFGAGARNALEADVQEQINRNKKARTRGEFVADAAEGETEDVPMADGTPKEWKQKLRELVGKFGEGAKEKVSGGPERMKTHLSGRLGELDTAIAAKTEKGFRSLGEWYGKLGWKSKVAVGLSLGIGMGVSAAAGASIPAALGLVFTGAGIGAQRIAGLSAMFLKYEKSAQDGKWEKEKAMGKAILYTAGMTGAMMLLVEGVKEAIDFANQPQKDEAILRWIGSMTGNKTLAPDTAPGPEIHAPVVGEAAPTTAPEATAPTTIEMPTVKASAGHGYEYMMKRLWEDLHTKGVELPANANPESDLARLLAADEDSIDKLVHEIASDSKHQFFRADGSSVLITPDAQMTIGARGELFLSDAGRELQVAPAHVAVTPTAFTIPHVESPAPTPEALDLYFGTQSAAPQEINPLTGLVNEQTPAPVETAMPHTIAPEQIVSPEPVKTVDLTPAQDVANQGTAEAVRAPIMEPHSVVNSFGVEVPAAVPHLYADSANRIFAYGGSPVERGKMILDYLIKNPDKIIYAADDNGEHRIPWHLVDGKVVPSGAPVQTTGFLGFFREFMKAPGPDEFEKVIK